MIDPGKTTLEILEGGPTRVMVGPAEAITPELAKLWRGIVPTIVFVRDDGWSIGAPSHLQKEVEALYHDESWAFVLRDFQQRLAEFRSSYIGIITPPQ